MIGTSNSGLAAIRNVLAGVSLVGASAADAPNNNVIGGLQPGAGNLISGNGATGVVLTNGSAVNAILGNQIGPDIEGNPGIGNQTGVVVNNASSNAIGGAVAAAANIIGFNTGAGVVISSGVANLIRGNSILSNGGLGIDLAGDGVTPNDAGDGDTGANNLQNTPVITAAVSAGGGTAIVGTLNSTPSTQFTLDFFVSATCDGSGFGEGATFIGSTTVTTDAAGNATFTATFAGAIPLGQPVTATATNPAGNTSEFSACLQVSDISDVMVAVTAAPLTAVSGTNITYTITVTNDGPGIAAGVVVTATLPAQSVFVSCASTGGGVCGGAGSTRTVTIPTLGPKAAATITIVVRADCSQLDGTTIRNVVNVTSATPDSNLTNNVAAVNVTGTPQPVLSKTGTSLGPVKPTFVRKVKKGAADVFTITNTGCAPVNITSARILRTGGDVNSGRIGNADDSASYALTIIGPNAQRTPVPLPTPAGFSLQVPAGQTLTLELLFTAVIPQLAGATEGLSANEAIGAVNTSQLSLVTSTGVHTFDVTGRVRTAPRVLAPATLSKSRQSMTVEVGIWDADLNVNRIRYDFLSAGGGIITTIDVDVSSVIAQRNLVTGQSFRVIVDFAGDNEEVNRVRVTVFDQDGSNDTTGSANPISPASVIPDLFGPAVRVAGPGLGDTTRFRRVIPGR
jgi:uncharacterized repeat protein (TIGR01451 family)